MSETVGEVWGTGHNDCDDRMPHGPIREGVRARRVGAHSLRQRGLGRHAAQRGAGVVADQGLAQTLDQLDVDLRVGACVSSVIVTLLAACLSVQPAMRLSSAGACPGRCMKRSHGRTILTKAKGMGRYLRWGCGCVTRRRSAPAAAAAPEPPSARHRSAFTSSMPWLTARNAFTQGVNDVANYGCQSLH